MTGTLSGSSKPLNLGYLSVGVKAKALGTERCGGSKDKPQEDSFSKEGVPKNISTYHVVAWDIHARSLAQQNFELSEFMFLSSLQSKSKINVMPVKEPSPLFWDAKT